MSRLLFCEISPLTYKISVFKERLKRHLENLFNHKKYARTFSGQHLPFLVYNHNSLIRRKLGNVDMQLQENKAINLTLAAPKINGVLIKPGETFSFWKLVGLCNVKKGYKLGLTISHGKTLIGVGGGMCQFSNMLHWLVLHSPLEICEHHHHNGMDLFPDFGREIPFGTGTSIMYNYLDYQFVNKTENTFQVIIYTTDDFLCGELRAAKPTSIDYLIYEDDSYFFKKDEIFYRHNKVFQKQIDKCSGIVLKEALIAENYSRVMYDKSFINKNLIKTIVL